MFRRRGLVLIRRQQSDGKEAKRVEVQRFDCQLTELRFCSNDNSIDCDSRAVVHVWVASVWVGVAHRAPAAEPTIIPKPP